MPAAIERMYVQPFTDFDEALEGADVVMMLRVQNERMEGGFIPSTRAQDGDPLDVMLLMDEPAFPGCLIPTRLLGVIEAEQTGDNGGGPLRNDRLIAVPQDSHREKSDKDPRDLPKQVRKEIEKFFVNYHANDGKKFKVLGCKGPDIAAKRLKRAARIKAA